MQPIQRTLTRCLVCGFAEVRADEVVAHGVVLLAECPRCEHRWTARLAGEPAHPPLRSAVRELAFEDAHAA